jgi:putative transposase
MLDPSLFLFDVVAAFFFLLTPISMQDLPLNPNFSMPEINEPAESKLPKVKKNYACILLPIISLTIVLHAQKKELKVRTVAFDTTNKQKQLLYKCFNATRYIYNLCVSRDDVLRETARTMPDPETKQNAGDDSQEKKVKKKPESFYSKLMRAAREMITIHVEVAAEWLRPIHSSVKDEAIADYVKAIKSSNALKKAGKIKRYELHFRKKIDDAAIAIRRGDWRNGKWCSRTFPVPFRSTEGLPQVLKHDCRMSKTKDGKFFLHVVEDFFIPPAQEAPPSAPRIISLDPGVRTFLTAFDIDGYAYKFGNADMSKIFRLLLWFDKLQSSIADRENNHNRRYKLRQAAIRLRRRIKNLIREAHRKIIKFLLSNFDVIVLPWFNSRQMSKKTGRKISRATTRKMLTWNHFAFRSALITKAREHPSCKVLISEESYTSKTCTQCGLIHPRLGGSKIFNCPNPNCSMRADRDIAAARNILLKHHKDMFEKRVSTL